MIISLLLVSCKGGDCFTCDKDVLWTTYSVQIPAEEIPYYASTSVYSFEREVSVVKGTRTVLKTLNFPHPTLKNFQQSEFLCYIFEGNIITGETKDPVHVGLEVCTAESISMTRKSFVYLQTQLETCVE